MEVRFHAPDGGYSIFNGNSMSAAETVKTTVRLPADLHWKFQGERAKRRLSNEKAIRDAFATWISSTPAAISIGPASTGSRSVRIDPSSETERRCVNRLLRILRNAENRSGAAAITAVIDALYEPLCESMLSRPGDEPANGSTSTIRPAGKKRKPARKRNAAPC